MGHRISRALFFAGVLLFGCEGVVVDEGDCPVGTLGCECAAGDVCALSPSGQMLSCDRGVCAFECTRGDTICLCDDDGACLSGGDECGTDGYCRPAGCAAGEEHCTCLAGACAPGLHCLGDRGPEGSCVDATGYPGGPCPAEGMCHGESRCDADIDMCVVCEPGSAGCVPDGERCDFGLELVAGRCVSPPPGPPADARCYTRCRADLVTADGTVRRCDAEGLIEGCVGDFECVEGSCVPPGETPDGCSSDAECPDFQHCTARRCYSDCTRDSECSVGRVCDHHVCRAPCERTDTTDTCPEGTYCDSESGGGGACVPLAADPTAPVHTAVDGGFELSRESLVIVGSRASFQIRTDSLSAEPFVLTRLSHRAFDRDGAVVDEADAREGTDALSWLELRYAGASSREATMSVSVEPGCGDECAPVEVRAVADAPRGASGWEGTIRIEHASFGTRYVHLSYAEGLDGRWIGDMHYFANFDERGLADWRASDRSDAATVGNALIRQWTRFRRNDLSLADFEAVLTSTRTESWRLPDVQAACEAAGQPVTARCYPHDGSAAGVQVYTLDERTAAIPSGSTELPIALNLRADATDGSVLRGRIESAVALHLPGNPAVTLRFDAAPDPMACSGDDPNCFPTGLSSDIIVGARYRSAGACETGFETVAYPWLVPGFLEGTAMDASTRTQTRTECRDATVPLMGSEAGGLNAALSGANPVPDGRARRRRLQLVDGRLVGPDTLVILFEERFGSILDPTDRDPASGFGYMVLRRGDTALEAADFEGSVVPPPSAETSQLGVSCDPDLLRDVLAASGGTSTLDSSNVAPAVRALLTGQISDSPATVSPTLVHTYCHDTGLIDGGPEHRGEPTDVRVACPPGSDITYFAFTGTAALTQPELAALRCQVGYDAASGARASCGATVNGWRTGTDMSFDLLWSCIGATYCSGDRTDLVSGRTFYPPGETLFAPIESAIEDAFRYKLRFRSASGRTAGFTPQICGVGSDLYCYDPEAIESIRARVDCLAQIYRDFGDPTGTLRSFLSHSLSNSSTEDPTRGDPLVEDGFERLYAELVIMLGDEALTSAYRSRFDPAATRGAAFRGSSFEPSGIDLSGVAGYEMRSLYQAVQYYQIALDRLYDLGPTLYTALSRTPADVGTGAPFVVTPGLVTWYLERVVRGASQKSRAWAEIARRYQRMNRPGLARQVLERAYTASYLESIVIAQLMHRIADRTESTSRDEIERAIEDAQRGYAVSLADMREVYGGISDDVTYFGFAADYVPFPVRDDNDTRASNAFEDVLRTSELFVSAARRAEDEAITSARSFDSDAVSFESELVRIGRSYEDRLGPICGYFTGRDGGTYPAIASYASQSERASTLGDPCGLMGNGSIHQQIGELSRLSHQRQILRTRFDHLRAELEDEAERVDRQCGLIRGIADFEYSQGTERISLQARIQGLSLALSTTDRVMSHAGQVLNLANSVEGAVSGGAAALIYSGMAAASTLVITGLQIGINHTERQMAELDLETARWRTERQCDQIRIDSDIVVRGKLRQLLEMQLEAQQLELSFRLAQSELHRMVLEARRIQEQRAEAEQLAFDVEAARNDPNVRIFRNTAMINADVAFERAVRHAYRATRVYEYYTSQTYPERDRLFRIRLVGRGDDNLEDYMSSLHEAFLFWEEDYRAPGRRVRRMSLRDDIFAIPYQDERGRELSQAERNALMRERLTDPMLLDANGHLSVPFSTTRDQVSRCTRNHKIDWVEAQLIGSDLGDDQAELRLWMDGTSVVDSLGEGIQYYRFDEALAVLDPYFGRNQIFDPAVYRRYDFRDRPFINTSWSLVLDQRDEPENQDIDLGQLTDIVLYLYYTDFTSADACRR